MGVLNMKDASHLAPERLLGYCLNDRYRLEALAGCGSTAWVFKAQDLRRLEACALGGQVAVKILRLGKQRAPRANVGLEREGARLQRLRHPNIVGLYDFNRDGDWFYLVMEWLGGPTLDRLIGRLGSPKRESGHGRALIAGLIAGLDHAHRQGVVHGDLKPANLMLDDRGQPRILDFGVAGLVGALAGQADNGAGFRGFTPCYASPRRLRGHTLAPGDDVYALACVIYEILAGLHPYARRTALEARQLGLRPRRPQGLTWRQWRALSRALDPNALEGPKLTELAEAFGAATGGARGWLP